MNKREAYNMGKDRGECIASWLDIPELGVKIPRELDWVGYNIVTSHNLCNVCDMLAHELEGNARQFSPFEFTAQEINSQTPEWRVDGLWEAFDAGITRGITVELRKRFRDYD